MNIFCTKNKRKRAAIFLLFIMLLNIVSPTISYALTSGPSQPEVQSFEPASTTEMVNLFTGDFTYNIPLFELPGPNGGYPFNLAYHAGIGMDQEASWVGLGWNLNPGAISRQMRGLPDEFNGDEVSTTMSMKPSTTIGVGIGASIEVFGGAGNLGGDLSIYNNNYKGVGYSLDGSIGYGKAMGSGYTYGIGLNFTLDSQNGIGLNPTLSLKKEYGKQAGDSDFIWRSVGVSAGLGYNSSTGLSSLTIGTSKTYRQDRIKSTVVAMGTNASSSLSLLSPGMTPSVGTPMINTSVHVSAKVGGSLWGVFPNGSLFGFYNKQKFKYQGEAKKYYAYGYLNYQNAEEGDPLAILDFNREKDGVVRKENPNLGIPSLTYDIYSAVGQGLSAMYRPFRSDVGIVHDPYAKSTSNSYALGVDLGPAIAHVGGNLGVQHGESESGVWSENNNLKTLYDFRDSNADDLYEPWYFKSHGEHTSIPVDNLSDIGDEKPVSIELTGSDKNAVASSGFYSGETAKSNSNYNRERTAKNNVIVPITNEQLLDADGNEVIDLFKINYINSSDSEVRFDRSDDERYPEHHIAGFSVTTPGGLRYVYALPALNQNHEEYTFSTNKGSSTATKVNIEGSGNPKYDYDNTNEFFSKKEIPVYAHSYLLTAIVGQDYVDVDGNGVSEHDLGYWVKFTYKRQTTASNFYKWRLPFQQANYIEGYETSPEDDLGSFNYGEKELWYLKRAETKTHIANFVLSDRNDSYGAASKLQNTGNKDNSVKPQRLSQIELATRFAPEVPLKRVIFDNDHYDLCNGVPNSSSGKLTLKGLKFEYGYSGRGSLTPYTFDYHEDVAQENPDYSMDQYDRWGNYKSGNPIDVQEFPYVDQENANKAATDRNAAVWSLKEITTPSGGKIHIDYESDDYAHVQHRKAMNMYEMVDPTDASSDIDLKSSNLKVRFKLHNPVSTEVDQSEEIEKYIEPDRDLIYFKGKTSMRKSSENLYEFVSGYVEIDRSNMGLEDLDSDGYYDHGYFHVEPEEGYNPMRIRAWQFLKMERPILTRLSGRIEPDDLVSDKQLVSVLKALGEVGHDILRIFEGYYDYSDKMDWGRMMVKGKSWVRLLDPDGRKYGGGLRVKQITFKDGWNESGEEEGIYGQYYEYLSEDETTSSGVASYEPIIGGDENAVRYARRYTQNIPLHVNLGLFFEYPANEGYYPAPQVGYGRVTVQSLASKALNDPDFNLTDGSSNSVYPGNPPDGYGVTGKTVNEFYTAKDFPVISEHTEKKDKSDKFIAPLLFFSTSSSKYFASQGYSVITNDMHGKPKSVKNYGQSTDGSFSEDPYSWVTYYYHGAKRAYDRQEVNELRNEMVENTDGTLSFMDEGESPDYLMGQETEFFLDMRHHTDMVYSGGLNANVDFLLMAFFGTIPAPSAWPQLGENKSELKTVVTNKVIFKSGILDSIQAYDDGSLITTKNLKFDKLTGKPVLTSVNNNFDQPLYTMNMPAYQKYDGMGPAYDNSAFTFSVNSLSEIFERPDYFTCSVPGSAVDGLFEGDEIVFIDTESGDAAGVGVLSYKDEETFEFYSEDDLNGDYEAFVYRSGKRNLISVDAGSISSLKHPDDQSAEEKTYTIELQN